MANTQAAHRIQMHRTHTIDGITLSFSRSILGWVASFGADFASEGFVHFRQPIKGGVWVGKRHGALEPIAVAPTLADAVRKCRAHFDALRKEAEDQARRRIAAAFGVAR